MTNKIAAKMAKCCINYSQTNKCQFLYQIWLMLQYKIILSRSRELIIQIQEAFVSLKICYHHPQPGPWPGCGPGLLTTPKQKSKARVRPFQYLPNRICTLYDHKFQSYSDPNHVGFLKRPQNAGRSGFVNPARPPLQHCVIWFPVTPSWCLTLVLFDQIAEIPMALFCNARQSVNHRFSHSLYQAPATSTSPISFSSKHDLHVLCNTNCRVQVTRSHALTFNINYGSSKASRIASHAKTSVVGSLGPGFANLIIRRISCAI